MYKAVVTYSNELMHFNKNHSPANGQFTTGDGDGDGIVDDHRNQYKIDKKVTKDNIAVITANRKRNKIVDKAIRTNDKVAKEKEKKIYTAFEEAAKEYKKTKNINKIAEILHKEMSDIPYDYFISDRTYTDNGEKYVDFYLSIYGKKYVREIVGSTADGPLSIGGDVYSVRGYPNYNVYKK